MSERDSEAQVRLQPEPEVVVSADSEVHGARIHGDRPSGGLEPLHMVVHESCADGGRGPAPERQGGEVGQHTCRQCGASFVKHDWKPLRDANGRIITHKGRPASVFCTIACSKNHWRVRTSKERSRRRHELRALGATSHEATAHCRSEGRFEWLKRKLTAK